jgi:hypothetical protein
MTNAQIGSQWQDAISGYAMPAPALAPVLHLPPDVLAALRRMDNVADDRQIDEPSQWDGFDDMSEEGGLK